MSAARAPRVPVEERLFSLVLALLATEPGLTKSEILSTVQGYRQKYSSRGDNAALERQFERDKDDIRDLGVPLETLDDPAAAGNNQMLRYRIPRGAYELPVDISFSSEETALLTLAAMVWREGTLSGESRRALLKLRSLGGTATVPELDYAPRIRARDAAFEPLRDALDRGVLVRFQYLKPGETEPRRREVAPYALVQHQGRWMAASIEADTGLRKTFLLSRIIGPVSVTSIAFERPADATADAALAALDEVWAARTATIRVTPGSDAETRLTKRLSTGIRDDDVLIVHYSDQQILADELASFGPEVTVLEPAELRDLVVSRLLRVLDVHSADPSPSGGDRG
ncbi:helix-turn-helix transcriptional regulator [Frigoribacterium faeni]|uniref:Proteasome accessory factor B n=1 Tax=Frigoribacterium faeni TaxID=145483 RepID=A0A7W3PIR7_9MICO|nr:WYL domain-containing protein [Frigoribacterium faeni]MBA8812954.1 proteasome accessory factor B [Frigoribacterium faeni]GEK81994.1 WYL domain-containing protein [Frigoribacterium faeni]